MPSELKILDCTIRDGGYINHWDFEPQLVRETYRAVSKAGVAYMEIGYRGTETHFNAAQYGLWRFSKEADINAATHGMHGAQVALMADSGKIEPRDFVPAAESQVKLIRVAAHKTAIVETLQLLEAFKKRGYQVALNAMGTPTYTPEELKQLLNEVRHAPHVDMVYAVDSYGSLFPNQVPAMLEPFCELKATLPDIAVGFHPHNSLQMAFANTLEAIRCGVDIVDATFYGMGRGAGNLPTEIILLYLELTGEKRYNVIPVLNCLDTYYLPLWQKYRWGYQLPYMLSGMFACHPSYAKRLVDYREYTIEDVCRGMEMIKQRQAVGFSAEVLDEVMQHGLMGRVKKRSLPAQKSAADAQSTRVTYAKRHAGRDFLVLANGPSLKENKLKIEQFIARLDPIVLGANNLSELFVPHYHAFNNKKRFMKYAETVHADSRLLISRYFDEDWIREYIERPYEALIYRDELDADFAIKNAEIQVNCRTISVLLVAVAMVMGARRIFIAGMDGYLDTQPGKTALYYEEADEQFQQQLIVERHQWCQHFLEQMDAYWVQQGHEGLHIITPTTYKAFYKGIENYLDAPALSAVSPH